ncbi:hypothetical protein H7I02_04845 [Mycolicibacterium brumae]|uniref:Di-and tripeptidase n=1 Tax=Mycolicibacterium brumae TaxID=85968 RepID=A0A2G5PBQ7_9MYCO|nr:hypothetical protein [Mycolicibacterium brumae]PIB75443.1 hypothetical protein CQY22_009780 [Mycolicibacterium brumae]
MPDRNADSRSVDPVSSAENAGSSAKILSYLLETSSRLQGPAIRAYVARVRRKHPEATPADVIKRMRRMYLASVVGSGAAVGAAAILPGIGTLAALAAISGETLVFLEATTLYVLAVAEVHGVEPTDHRRRRALVLAVLAGGEDGKHAVANVIGSGRIQGGWLSEGAAAIPMAGVSQINSRAVRYFAKKWAVKRTAVAAGKLLPLGLGAVIGGIGNWLIGRKFTQNAEDAFGPAPTRWPGTLRALPELEAAHNSPVNRAE